MMERLTKRQKEILTKALKVFPGHFPLESGESQQNILADIKLLEKKNLVTADYTISSYFPTGVTITPIGIEKLQENIITRLLDTGWKNPWVVVAVIVSLISIGSTLYFSHTTEKIQLDLNEIKGKIAEYDTLIVKNITSDATYNKISIQCPNGTMPAEGVNDSEHYFYCVPK